VPLDADAAAYLSELARIGSPAISELPPVVARRLFDEGSAPQFGAIDHIESVSDLTIEGPNGQILLRVYRPHTDRDLPTVAFFHGGGWVVGSLDSHDGLCRALAKRASVLVVAVDYRLAPEHPFPAGLEDAWAATKWLSQTATRFGGRTDILVVAGDSAGGNLAASVALRARDKKLPLALQLLVYPVMDCDFDRQSYRQYAEGYGLTRDAMMWFWDQYAPLPDRFSPEASPLRADDICGIAPALIVTAEFDPLRDEGEEYARRHLAAGVPVELRRYDGLIHGFGRHPAFVPRALKAIDETAVLLRNALESKIATPPEEIPQTHDRTGRP
jgi:acetyl esterase